MKNLRVIILFLICLLFTSSKPVEIIYHNNEHKHHNLVGVNEDIVKYISIKEMLKINSKIESRGKYNIANKYGYIGKYQIGKLALLDINYDTSWIQKVQESIYSVKDSTSGYTNYYFDLSLFPPSKQEEAIIKLIKRNEKVYLKKTIEKYVGKTIDDVKITKAGILSASFLGSFNVITFLDTNGENNPTDGFGHTVRDRLEMFQNIELK